MTQSWHITLHYKDKRLLASSTLGVVSAVGNIKWSTHRRFRLDEVRSVISVSVGKFCHRVQPCELLGTVEQQTPLYNKHIGDIWQHKTIFPVVHFTEWPSSFDFWSCEDCPKVCCCPLQKVHVSARFSHCNVFSLYDTSYDLFWRKPEPIIKDMTMGTKILSIQV